eukprot:gnl/TRDRNA2_/TRDRNA2_194694_c0_seq1.p1 gnl/TRDRNA2_/TRDRNA2_194694_c0~~gnl/TRDRNA2_/TRDRNA2_194694_c0_seq1.p1  ORF type:complete len:265 (+),score=40.03 gnl/TRDRNA2_/TRDRNA2_194694_c0_seq1:106-900(+)
MAARGTLGQSPSTTSLGSKTVQIVDPRMTLGRSPSGSSLKNVHIVDPRGMIHSSSNTSLHGKKITLVDARLGQSPSQSSLHNIPGNSLGQSRSGASLGNSVSVASLLSTASDTPGGGVTVPPLSNQAAFSPGEALQPYMQQVPPQMAGGYSAHYGSGQYQQTSPAPRSPYGASQTVPMHQQPQELVERGGGSRMPPAQHAAAQGMSPQAMMDRNPHPVWVIEEVIEFGQPYEEVDNGSSPDCRLRTDEGGGPLFNKCVHGNLLC